MGDVINYVQLPTDLAEWPRLFRQADFDCVLDPMVVRAAELFAGGSSYCRKIAPQGQDQWSAIENNLDGVLAFFHVLMTRERICLINYGETFMSQLTTWLGNIVLNVDTAAVYGSLKQRALARLETMADSLPQGPSLDLDKQLLATGYFWQPSLGGLQVKPEAEAAARFILGGLIFGEYAQAGGADHLLQAKRLGMMSGLKQNPDAQPDWEAEERRLFKGINNLVNRDKALKVKDAEVLPNVLLHLLAQGVTQPRALLDKALEIRASDAGKAYRAFNRRLHDAWLLGREDAAAEKELAEVAKELKRRISGKPLVLTQLEIKGKAKGRAKAGADAGIASAQAEVSGEVRMKKARVPVTIPSALRNWFVDTVLLTRHQKLLLRMALDQRSFVDTRTGMQNIWRAA